ncbi:hypothetical protein [Phycicoccus sp. 3266]|uniref:hypothetical protein n=1 Tax=Phycicoccus sp. 3266 TaxID=2817751 RepID=UPI002858E5BE|nr:hypothetical protein [Phycicoccus sp. 3266]MDR6861985.1 hypothetical protein [Phycicoccus sp. 3266]
MPWSDWVDPGIRSYSVFGPIDTVVTVVEVDGQAAIGTPPDTLLAPLHPAAEAWSGATSSVEQRNAFEARAASEADLDAGNGNTGAFVQRLVTTAMFDALRVRPERESFPWELNDLEYGVDYTEIPGTSDYVVWEDGNTASQVSDFDSWDGYLTLTITQATIGTDQLTDLHVLTSVQAANVAWPTEPYFEPNDPVFTNTAFSGNVVLEFVGAAGLDNTAAFRTVERKMQVVTEVAHGSLPLVSEQVVGIAQTTFNISLHMAPPRFRYWKPDTKKSWVRLLHRGDGLGVTPKRLRTGGATHQAGRLRGSY